MKTTASSSGRTGIHRRKGLDPDRSPYASAKVTKALFSAGAAARMQRLNAGDMLTADEAAQFAGTSRVTVNAWISEGRAIALKQTRGGYRLPKWQFEPAVWDVLPLLSRAMGTSEGWALLSFLETPLGGLGGRTPRQAIEQGAAHLAVELAEAHGT